MPVADRFAALRKTPGEVSQSFLDALPVTGVTKAWEHENPQKTAMLPVLPALPAEKSPAEQWRARSVDLVDQFGMAKPWADGLAAMEQRPVPSIARPERWQQIVCDSTAFLTRWHAWLTETGWTVFDVFGFDEEENVMGVALLIRGGTVETMDGAEIVIADGRTRRFCRRLGGRDGPLLWNFDKLKTGKRP